MAAPTTNLANGEPKYLTIKDAAAIMGISVKTLYRMFSAGRIPEEAGFVRWFDYTIRVREDLFLNWLDWHHPGQPKTRIQ